MRCLGVILVVVPLVAPPVVAEDSAKGVAEVAADAADAGALEEPAEPKVEVAPLTGTVIRWNSAFGALHLEVDGTEFVVPVTNSTQLVNFSATLDAGLGVKAGDKVETSLGDEGERILRLLAPAAEADQKVSTPTPTPSPTPPATPTPEPTAAPSATPGLNEVARPENQPEPTPSIEAPGE